MDQHEEIARVQGELAQALRVIAELRVRIAELEGLKTPLAAWTKPNRPKNAPKVGSSIFWA